MTHKVQRSQLGGVHNFADVVAIYAKDLRDHNDRKEAVAAGEADPHPAPHAPEIVRKCLNDRGQPDFEIVEDVPVVSVDAVRARRNQLVTAVITQEVAATDLLSPPGRRALRALRYGEATIKDEKDRSADERAFVAEYEAERAKLAAIHRASAEAQDAIEDLPEDKLWSWTAPTFVEEKTGGLLGALKKAVIGVLALAAVLIAGAPDASAQTQSGCKYIVNGAVLTAAQWNWCFQQKQDSLGYTPVNKAGDVMTGELFMLPSSTVTAGINLGQGAAPTSPANGDAWITSGGMFARAGGVTYGPFVGAGGGTFGATAPITVSFPAGVVTYACATCVTSSGGGAITGTAPIAVSAAGVVSITGAAGQILAGSPAAFTATPTLGASGTLGSITLGNATSGLVTLRPVTGALGTVTVSLPAATDTLVGKATTDTLTNKTFDTAGTGNSFSIAGVAVTANSGTGSVARATGPTLASPTFTGTVTGSNTIPLTILAQSAANTMLGNWSGSTANVTANAIPSCPDSGGNHLNYVSGTGITCGTGIGNGITALTGEVTATGPGSVAATIAANAVTYAKFQQVAASSLVGNATVGLANATGVTLGATLAFSGSALQTAAGTGDVAWLANSFATTLATVNSNVGSFGSSTAIPTVTVNGKGLVTAVTTNAVIAPAGTLTGATLAANVLASSLTSVGALAGGSATTGFTINAANVTWSGQIPGASVATAANASGSPSATFGVVKCDGTTITCASGIITSIGGVATSVQVGVTTVTSGTTLNLLYNNAGVLANATIASFLSAGNGILVTGTTTAGLAVDIATNTNIWSATANKPVDAAGMAGSLNLVGLTDAATVAVDFNTGINFTVTLGGNRTLGNPTNAGNTGRSGCIYVVQDGTGSRTLAYSSNWKFVGGTAPVLTTTASAVDKLCYTIRTSTFIDASLQPNVK